ncbi:hypothetical protein C8J57DRAFT_1473746 [Mycena rebaudengoi]|nr:hypothetical protein C8J57DRAFT_1473746 [Mycena rebaudengoi]
MCREVNHIGEKEHGWAGVTVREGAVDGGGEGGIGRAEGWTSPPAPYPPTPPPTPPVEDAHMDCAAHAEACAGTRPRGSTVSRESSGTPPMLMPPSKPYVGPGERGQAEGCRGCRASRGRRTRGRRRRRPDTLPSWVQKSRQVSQKVIVIVARTSSRALAYQSTARRT